MTIDVVVCTRNRPRELARCLASLSAQSRPPARVLVVHGGEPRGRVRDEVPGLEIEERQTEAGLPRQRNLGLRLVDADAVAFFDDDVELEPGYLEAVARFFGSHPRCAGLSGNITNDPVRSRPVRAFRTVFSLANDDGRLRPSGDGAYLRHPRSAARVDVLSGSNMIFRRSAIQGLQFDERLQGYGYMEDVDFSLRAASRGELWSIPDARLLHTRTPTSRLSAREYPHHVIVNSALLFRSHRALCGLSRVAFARRIMGRVIAYGLLGARRGTTEPLAGALAGVRHLPAALRGTVAPHG